MKKIIIALALIIGTVTGAVVMSQSPAIQSALAECSSGAC
jgi:hypothetical protein